jgi:predicted metal-dependent hydrolase
MINLKINKEYVVNFIRENATLIENNFERFVELVDNSELNEEDAFFIAEELEKSDLHVFAEAFDRKYFSRNAPTV